MTPLPSFNVSPSPRAGQGAYGRVPGNVGLPPSIWQQTGQAVPLLPQLTKSASSAIGTELQGNIHPETRDLLQTLAAQYGVSSGMPGSGLATNNLVRSLGLTSEGIIDKGIQNLSPFLSTIGQQQLNPETAAQIAEQNAVYAAAPDPRQAALEQVSTMKDMYNWEQNQGPQQGYWDVFGWHGTGQGIAPPNDLYPSSLF